MADERGVVGLSVVGAETIGVDRIAPTVELLGESEIIWSLGSMSLPMSATLTGDGSVDDALRTIIVARAAIAGAGEIATRTRIIRWQLQDPGAFLRARDTWTVSAISARADELAIASSSGRDDDLRVDLQIAHVSAGDPLDASWSDTTVVAAGVWEIDQSSDWLAFRVESNSQYAFAWYDVDEYGAEV